MLKLIGNTVLMMPLTLPWPPSAHPECTAGETATFLKELYDWEWVYEGTGSIAKDVHEPITLVMFSGGNDSIKLETRACTSRYCSTGVAVFKDAIRYVFSVDYFNHETCAPEGEASFIVWKDGHCKLSKDAPYEKNFGSSDEIMKNHQRFVMRSIEDARKGRIHFRTDLTPYMTDKDVDSD